MYFKTYKKIFFFSLAMILFTGCNKNMPMNENKSLQGTKDSEKVETIVKDEKELSKALNEILILDVERSPVRVMRSLVLPYTLDDKAIGTHTVDMIIDFGKWNTSVSNKKENKTIGSLNE